MLPKDIVEYLKKECKITDEYIKRNEDKIREKIEYIGKYGMCPIHTRFIEPYEGVVEELGEIPALLGDDEPDWKFGILMMVKQEYASRAEWTIEMAFREFLQNALDGAEEVGRTIKDIKVDYKNGFLVVENPSKKLLIKHMEIGGSEKPCWSRGRYGEGLDVASSWIVDTGGTVYILSHDTAYRFIGGQGRLVLLVADIPHIGDKTVVMIYHPDAHKMLGELPKIVCDVDRTMYTVWAGSISCPNPMPNRILQKSGERAKIYHRNIFVNYVDVLFNETNAVFDYDAWWFTISRDRKHINSAYELVSSLRKIYNILAENLEKILAKYNWEYQVPEIENSLEYKVLSKIVQHCLDTAYALGGVYFTYSGRLLEHAILANSLPYVKRVYTYVLLNEISKIIGKNKVKVVGYVHEELAERIRDYIYQGFIPVVFQGVDPRITELKSIDEMIMEKDKETSKELKDIRIPLADYPEHLIEFFRKYGGYTIWLANKVVNYTRTILYMSHSENVIERDLLRKRFYTAEFNKTKLQEEEETGRITIGFYDPKDDTVCYGIDRLKYKIGGNYESDKMFDIAFEEYVHYETGYSDNTSMFEKGLISYAREFAEEIAIDDYIRLYYLMSKNGLFINVMKQREQLLKVFETFYLAKMARPTPFKKLAEYISNIDTSYFNVYKLEVGEYPTIEYMGLYNPYSYSPAPEKLLKITTELSPVILIGKTKNEPALLMVIPEDRTDSKFIDACIGTILTEREGYIKEMINLMNQSIQKLNKKIEVDYIVVLRPQSIVVLDANGNKIEKVEWG